MSGPTRPAPNGITTLQTSIARHRRDVQPIAGVVLSPGSAERHRIQEILRRAGHTIFSTGDSEDALDLYADEQPTLFMIVADEGQDADVQDAVDALKQLRVLRAGWRKEVKIMVIGDGVPGEFVDLRLGPGVTAEALLTSVETLFRRSRESATMHTETQGSDVQASHEHLADIAASLGVDFAAEYVRCSLSDIQRQARMLEVELFRKNPSAIRSSLHAIQGLALNVDATELNTSCREWRAKTDDELLHSTVLIAQSIWNMLPSARERAKQALSKLGHGVDV
ncbi:hypothetical protein [Lysobacter sp. Root690]|uniref:hypothetical protein n=1 Tax=Lysobacter sp. Root690 TaxID=1736588 RepID=UPI0006F8F643|nr:hypothetical protein [Lysobacter sp. Root690]KRB11141.1 hypothetical protein ASD86_01490 [Lysobacter sp. Root690]